MSLIFSTQDIKNRNKGLTFNDVLIVPQRSDIRSRKDPSLKSRLTKNLEIDCPFISSNMDTITEFEMASAMRDLGAFGILHRFMSTEAQVAQVKQLVSMDVFLKLEM